MTKPRKWKDLTAAWTDVVLVCRKCSKKLDGGFGPDGDERLARVLRRDIDGDAGRKIKTRRRTVAVVEVGCLGICPKGAVVAMRAGDPGRWLVVPAGAAASEVAARLGLPRREGP